MLLKEINIRTLCILGIFGFTLAVIQVLVIAPDFNTNSIVYLDMGDALFSSSPNHFLNGYHSPLYPVFVGFGDYCFQAEMLNQIKVLYFIHLFIFLLTMSGFFLMMRNLISFSNLIKKDSDINPIDRALIYFMGFWLFLFVSIKVITVTHIGPELLISGMIYFVIGTFIDILQYPDKWLTWILFGIFAGLAYLANQYFFIFGLILFTVICLDKVRKWNRLLKYTISILIFLTIASLWVIPLSKSKGMLTIGEKSKLDYAWYVNFVHPRYHWQGNQINSGMPLHEERMIYNNPDVFEFSEPVYGSYPPAYDPSYWFEGVQIKLRPVQQLIAFQNNFWIYFQFLFISLGGWMPVILFLLILTGTRILASQAKIYLKILLPIFLMLFLIAMIHVEVAETAPFLMLVLIVLLLSIQFPIKIKRLSRVLCLVLIIFTCISIFHPILNNFLPKKESEQDLTVIKYEEELHAAKQINKTPIKSGDSIAYIGDGSKVLWVRLLGLKIIAEIPEDQKSQFFNSSSEVINTILDKINLSGADWIITRNFPRNVYQDIGFLPIDDTEYSYYDCSLMMKSYQENNNENN